MEKTVTIDGKQIRLKTTGATPLRYKAQFQKDYFKEILKMASLANIAQGEEIKPENLESLDFEVFYHLTWTMAKTADPSIPDPLTWLDTFDEFPIMEVLPELQELIEASFQTSKKK